ncbi:BrnA antitoxin family protein [Bosea lathyri]|uniref:BrnA antitoxin of type II toxin-antitoxin system n=1 Tax=Bosea lathyri TaxID=1036778 RepID=A0A1H6BU92_9HYPH|nr:BrnA antitoxin family protein [Bosea lathyri]SEG64230.1 BrnA antitoxin of type II toxin-antitoxin system [Bosea lathyri]
MNNDRTRRPSDPRKNAEALFKPAPPKAPPAAEARPTIPGARETVSLRIDSDVLEYFQSSGPGWQDRINDALRKAAGKS